MAQLNIIGESSGETLILDETDGVPAQPQSGSGRWKLYFKSTGPYVLDDAGVETGLARFTGPWIDEGAIPFGATGGGTLVADAGKLYFYEPDGDLVVDGDYWWRSLTSFTGRLAHANTGNRTYTFPDASGTIPLGTGTANQVTVWSGTNTLTGYDNFQFDNAAEQLTIKSAFAQHIKMFLGANSIFVATDGFGLNVAGSSPVVIENYLSCTALTSTELNKQLRDIDTIIYGDTAEVFRVDASTDRVGCGVAAPAAKWHVVHTAEQMRLGYDASVYCSFTLNSAGDLILNTTGDQIAYQQNRTTLISIDIQNTNNTTGTAHARMYLSSGGSSGGDAYIVMDTAAGAGPFWSFGIDNTDDVFKVSQNVTLGTNDFFKIAATGATTIAQWLNVGTATGAVAQGEIAASAQFFGANGAAATPSYSYGSAKSTGDYWVSAGVTRYSRVGTDVIERNGVGMILHAVHYLGWGSSVVSSADLYLSREGTSLLGIRSGSTLHNQISCVALTATVFNETGADIDTRIESVNFSHAFFVDASTDRIGIFDPTPDVDVDMHKDVSGGAFTVRIHNASDTVSARATLSIFTGGATASDPTIEWGNSVVTWSAGLDNADNDSFKVNFGSALTGTDFLSITTAGLVTVTTGPLYVGTSEATVDSAQFIVFAATNAYITARETGSNVEAKIQANTAGVAYLGAASNHPCAFVANNSEKGRFTTRGNFLIGTTTDASAGDGKVLIFGDNAAQPTPGANTAGFYGYDSGSGTVEAWCFDEAGNDTQLSPHDKDGYWFFHSRNRNTKRWKKVHVERLIEYLIEKDLVPAEFIEEGGI